MANRKNFSGLLLPLILASLIVGQSVQAVGVGVKPKRIDLQVKAGKATNTEFLVMNVDEKPALYQIYPDALEKAIEIAPTDFLLDAQASQLVKVQVKIKTPGLFSTNISIVARPLEASGFSAASGIKLPITISSSGWSRWWLIIGLIILLAACLGLVFGVKLLYKRKLGIRR